MLLRKLKILINNVIPNQVFVQPNRIQMPSDSHIACDFIVYNENIYVLQCYVFLSCKYIPSFWKIILSLAHNLSLRKINIIPKCKWILINSMIK